MLTHWAWTGKDCPACNGVGHDPDTADGGYGDDGTEVRVIDCEACDGSGGEMEQRQGESPELIKWRVAYGPRA